MSKYKEFQGKTLDDAIKEACDYYGVAREKLEIDILSDAKSGIFGLVGAKKAVIRATRVEIAGTVSTLLADKEGKQERMPEGKHRPGGQERESRPSSAPSGKSAARSARQESPRDAAGKEHVPGPAGSRGRPSVSESNDASTQDSPDAPHAGTPPSDAPGTGDAESSALRRDGASAAPGNGVSRRDKPRPPKDRKEPAGRGAMPGKGPARRRHDAVDPGRREKRGIEEPVAFGERDAAGPAQEELFTDEALDFVLEAGREDLPEFVLDGCDQDMVFNVVRGVVLSLVEPIVGPVPCQVEIVGKRVRATLDCGDASGLLVGRDGQTLAAVQYLAVRIVSRQLGGAVRLQIDAGKYRERQDDKLRELALSLAERVKESGRSQSTRPLSAYQRRIVHLALEHDSAVLTRSKGEGSQRRVVVYLNRDSAGHGEKTGEPERDADHEPPIRAATDLSDPYRLLVPGAVERTAGLGGVSVQETRKPVDEAAGSADDAAPEHASGEHGAEERA